jgi:hypothetical protein
MKQVKNTELVSSRVGRWYPGDLAFIERLELILQATGDSSELLIDARFQRKDQAKNGWPGSMTDGISVTLRFDHISNLALREFGGGVKQVMGFDIVDISDRGWEDALFEVEDYEDGCIKFYCKSVEVVAVN